MRVTLRVQPRVSVLQGQPNRGRADRAVRGVDLNRHRVGVDNLENQPRGGRETRTLGADESEGVVMWMAA